MMSMYLISSRHLSAKQTGIFFLIIIILAIGFFLIGRKKEKALIKQLEDQKSYYKSMGLDFIDPFGATVYKGFNKGESESEAYLLLFRDRMTFEILKEKEELLFKNIKVCRYQTGKDLRERGVMFIPDSSKTSDLLEKNFIYIKYNNGEIEQSLVFQVGMERGSELFYRDLCTLVKECNPSAIIYEQLNLDC